MQQATGFRQVFSSAAFQSRDATCGGARCFGFDLRDRLTGLDWTGWNIYRTRIAESRSVAPCRREREQFSASRLSDGASTKGSSYSHRARERAFSLPPRGFHTLLFHFTFQFTFHFTVPDLRESQSSPCFALRSPLGSCFPKLVMINSFVSLLDEFNYLY